tara:strand:+ start:10121 stop:10537 length:417 start_codon:yes stop_codon:yes gene_type:complete
MASLRSDLDTAMYDRLIGDSNLNVYPIRNGLLADDDPLPAIVFAWQDGDANLGRTFSVRGWEATYLVKAISESRWPKEASDIEDLIDDRLEGSTLTVTGFTHVVCMRGADVAFPELGPGGREFQHIGSLWTVMEDRSL